jgi:hypothetical protein
MTLEDESDFRRKNKHLSRPSFICLVFFKKHNTARNAPILQMLDVKGTSSISQSEKTINADSAGTV